LGDRQPHRAVGDESDLGAVWLAVTEEIADGIISAQQRAYLRLTRLRAIVEDTALLSVPDAFTRDQIESRLRPAITDALSRRLGRPIQVAVTVRPAKEVPAGAQPIPAARAADRLFDDPAVPIGAAAPVSPAPYGPVDPDDPFGPAAAFDPPVLIGDEPADGRPTGGHGVGTIGADSPAPVSPAPPQPEEPRAEEPVPVPVEPVGSALAGAPEHRQNGAATEERSYDGSYESNYRGGYEPRESWN